MNEVTRKFILSHLEDDVRLLALKTKKSDELDMTWALQQISGYQIARKKVPTWAKYTDIHYPLHLSLEQCSSEDTAVYKSTLMHGKSFVDLTGGMGVDCAFISKHFERADYIERQEELCKLARHNFALLSVPHIEVHHTDTIAYLEQMPSVDWILIDPARRNDKGGKTILVSDCEPNVAAHEELLVSKAKKVMVKLSPMLDITAILNELHHIAEIHVVSVKNECKELLLVLNKETLTDKENTPIVCRQLDSGFSTETFSFCPKEEEQAPLILAEEPKTYLYEPGSAVLKGGAYKLLSARYEVEKLHLHSHLYTSSNLREFPGRRFKVENVLPYDKTSIRYISENISQANVTTRNFPLKADELKKKLKIRDGGGIYLFATTLKSNEKTLLLCHKI